MRFLDSLLAEFDREKEVTRQVLVRIPEERASFRPHSKSYSMGDLALHLAGLPRWIEIVLRQTQYDLRPDPSSEPAVPRPSFTSMAATVATFEEQWNRGRAALVASSDAELLAMWTLKEAGRTLFTLPRAAVLRSWVFNHAIHHRGQLTVYLRLCNLPVPAVYGPTADTAISAAERDEIPAEAAERPDAEPPSTDGDC